jgi:Na+/phosphate symporter
LRWTLGLVSLFLFLFSLQLVRRGAEGLTDVALVAGSNGFLGSFGLGWVLACVFLSGSPVAALVLPFLGGGVISPSDTYATIMGSRIGASFVVLLIGFLYDIRYKGERGGVYVGALALITTASIYLPALGLGYLALSTGVFDSVALPGGEGLMSAIDWLYGPLLGLVGTLIPAWAQLLLGVALILVCFKLFDAALPVVDPTGGKLGRMATTIYRPSVAFLMGMIVTSITLSVSVSLTLLVPLTVSGVVRRENLIPYILGANITTFIDTLLASTVVGHPAAFGVVLCAALVVAALSVPVVFFAYEPYERGIDALATWVSGRRTRLTFFVLLVFAFPLLLILTAHL